MGGVMMSKHLLKPIARVVTFDLIHPIPSLHQASLRPSLLSFVYLQAIAIKGTNAMNVTCHATRQSVPLGFNPCRFSRLPLPVSLTLRYFVL